MAALCAASVVLTVPHPPGRYIVASGRVLIETAARLALLCEGDHFGEAGLIFARARARRRAAAPYRGLIALAVAFLVDPHSQQAQLCSHRQVRCAGADVRRARRAVGRALQRNRYRLPDGLCAQPVFPLVERTRSVRDSMGCGGCVVRRAVCDDVRSNAVQSACAPSVGTV